MIVRRLSFPKQNGSRKGFTLIEALVVAGIIGLLASLILPVLSNVKGRGYSIFCLNNERQLVLAWNLYAEDREGYLSYNYGIKDTLDTISSGKYANWANNVMTWNLEPENTNTVPLASGGLGPYLGGVVTPFRCPSDRALDVDQRDAGWTERTRSYSMNAMVGYPRGFFKEGKNINNPKHRQFLRMEEIPNPSGIFIFIEEHPDSINDGYFLYKHDVLPETWYDLPASYHYRGANVSFGDLHVEYRKWQSPDTIQPIKYAPMLPLEVPHDTRDYYWLMERTTVVY